MVQVIGNISQVFEVGTASEYLERLKGIDSEDAMEEFLRCERNNEEYDKLNEIIALEKSIFLHRRTSYSCGSITDSLWRVRRRLIDEYEKEFDKGYMDYNSDINW